MDVTFRQLRLFLALADTGSVSRAARALHVTQPTASMQLRQMARATGAPLHEPAGRGIRLTESGRELADAARRIFAAWDAFEQGVAARRGLAAGRLRVAVVSTAKYFMPRMVGGFCKLHPKVDVSLEILNRDGVVQRLREGRDDLYIMSMPPSDLKVLAEVILPNPIVVIAAEADPLCRRKSLRLADLGDRRLVLREPGSGTRMAVERHFRRQRHRADVRLELGSNEAIKQTVAAGLGIGILSRHALGATHPGLRELDVRGFPLPSAWHLVRSSAPLSPLAAAFREHLLRQLAVGVR